jgi:Membrane bound beta barrel domain (DUF5777)
MRKLLPAFCFIVFSFSAAAQDDLDSLLNAGDNVPKKEYVNNAFKSSRVIMGQSMEMIGAGVLDFRILHRFGNVKNGLKDLFGLDQASMRMSFDYGLTRNLTIGVGRSTLKKELDALVKYRVIQQSKGEKSFPVSLLAVAGITCNTTEWSDPTRKNFFTSRLGFYQQLIVGRKFSEGFTLQLSPTYVHRNFVELASDNNDMAALGIGARFGISRRAAIIIDAYPIVYGARSNYNLAPISVGLDIETGGHVFQLHFSNARGMNERAFITETTQDWGKGEFQFGFNLSRVFTIKKNKSASW